MSDTVGDAYLYGTDADESRQREALVSGDIPVAVYGLGKMGLPLAGVYADLTGNVMGADVDPAVVESVNRGDCHVDGEPGLAELVDRTVNDGSLQAVSDPATAAETARLHVVIVPTLITDEGGPISPSSNRSSRRSHRASTLGIWSSSSRRSHPGPVRTLSSHYWRPKAAFLSASSAWHSARSEPKAAARFKISVARGRKSSAASTVRARVRPLSSTINSPRTT